MLQFVELIFTIPCDQARVVFGKVRCNVRRHGCELFSVLMLRAVCP